VAPDDGPNRPTNDQIQKAVGWNRVLLIVLLIGLGWMALKLNSLPDELAAMYPDSDFSGEQADQAAGEILERLVTVQAKLDDLTVRLDSVCAIVAADRPNAGAVNPCVSPSP
jgi:hypothetical protein